MREEVVVPDSPRGGPPVIELVDSQATLYAAVLSWKVLPPFFGLVGAMLVFAAMFFYTTPRTGGANWESGTGVRNLVGFSPEVSFEGMGELLLSKARVMRVSFSNVKTGEIYTVMREPYLARDGVDPVPHGARAWAMAAGNRIRDLGRPHVVSPTRCAT